MSERLTIKVTTAPGTNASEVGQVYGAFDGVSWRNSVDACDADGCGRVFLDCDDYATVQDICERLEVDDRIRSYVEPDEPEGDE